MGEVMLHLKLPSTLTLGPAAGRVVGVFIADDGLGLKAVQAMEILLSALEIAFSLNTEKIADMGAEIELITDIERQGVFLLRAHGQQ